MPKVSIVVPLYNAEKYVKETINSLLGQTFTDFEIVVVDDKSKDNSYEIVSEICDSRIRLFRNDVNQGIAETRNRAIRHCRGEYVALMDDDDIAPSTRLEKEVEFLDANPDIDVVGGHCRFIDKEGNIITCSSWNVFQNPKYIKAYLLLGDAIPNSTAMIRRNFIERNQLQYRNDMFGAEDYRFWVECSFCGKISNLDEVLLYWRSGHDNETRRVSETKMEERRRAINGIREYAICRTGFDLNAQEMEILHQVFSENGFVNSNDELEQLFCSLKKMVTQAMEMKLDNRQEIKSMCRKRFGEKVGKAFYLWD